MIALLLGTAVGATPPHTAAKGGGMTPPGVSLDARTPATFTIPVAPEVAVGRSVLILKLEPTGSDPPASFVVRVAASPGAGGPETELGSAAFFPEAVLGQSRRFLLPVPNALARTAAEAGSLRVSLRITETAPGTVREATTLKVADAELRAGD
jgi:hypothetical protein